MPRRYNLRPRKDVDVKWIEDETLKDEDSEEEEDSDYEPSDHEEEDAELDEEMDESETETETESETSKPAVIQIPMPKKGMRVKIEIDNRDEDDGMFLLADDDDDEEDDEFMEYLMNKYVPPSRISNKRKKSDKEDDDEPELSLNRDEQTYFDELPKSKQKKFKKQMKQVALVSKDENTPAKFRILDLPIAESIKSLVIKKIDLLNDMDGGEVHKLRNWVDGFMRLPFGNHVPLPVRFEDGPKPCADFLSDTRKSLDKSVYGMNGAKTQIMQILAQWISNPASVGNVIALKGPPGVGKCHAKDTPILMYDGTVKLVQDIVIGDLVMGDDSTPRTVTNLGRGRDMMYDIIPTGKNKEKFTVNSEHILCLKQTGVGSIKTVARLNNKVAFKTIRFDNKEKKLKYLTFSSYEEAKSYLESFTEEDRITEISVKDYLKLPSQVKTHWLKGYKKAVEFQPHPVDFDPYILGLWLGDGTSCTCEITNQDATVLGYLNTALRKYDSMLVYRSKYTYRIRGYKKNKNVFLDFLQKYNLINNKHIPNAYKINSREIRLQVLAGLIDTDGYMSNNCYEITQKNKVLADDIVFLARSLGFSVTIKENEKSCMYKDEKRIGLYHNIIISGDLSEVPVRIARKKGSVRTQIKDHLVYGFEVREIGEGDYYGFTLDGNCRYFIGDFTVTHNTSFARNGIASALKRPFEFFSLGGATDSSTFVGHSYTYEGSTWGRIVDGLMHARCMNPVMYFDELDKVSTTPQGEEIISMLIHLTDRSQNTQFHDRYFAGVDFDLSQCLFVFSFNDENKVHPILRDRMQVIHCSGYNADEKKIILNQFIWPQILERIKMTDGLTITDEAVKHIIQEYSHEEEGVRNLIRSVETLVTRINLLRIADEATAKSYPFYTKVTLPMSITPDNVKHILQDMTRQDNESWRRLYV